MVTIDCTGWIRGWGCGICVHCSHGSAYAHYPCFITFSCHFFKIPPKYKKFKKKKKHIKHANTWIQQANNKMWTLSNYYTSRLASIHTKQALGIFLKFILCVCVGTDVCVWVSLYVCACVRARVWFNKSVIFFLLFSIYAFYLLIGQTFNCY